MTPEQQQRFELLKGRWCPFDFVRDSYGLDFTAADSIRRDFEFWLTQRKGESFRGETVDRWWLESFLQNRRLTSRMWMAVRLGMKRASLEDVIRAMDSAGVVLRYHTSNQIIGTSFDDDLWNQLPSLRDFTPADHNAECRVLHEQIEKQFGVRVEPEMCATARILGEQQYARHIDAVTLEALCVKYEVWLDFGKWMTLPPDRCSQKTYVENEAVIGPFVAGTTPPTVADDVRCQLLRGAA